MKNGFMEIELSFSDNSIMSVYFAIKKESEWEHLA